MKKKNHVVILGGGLIGKPIAIDLARNNEYNVTLVDIDPSIKTIESLPNLKVQHCDLSIKQNVTQAVAKADYVINAVPGFMGFNCLKHVIEEGKEVVDIAFYPEDPMELHELAIKMKVRVICDMGVAPGMSHLLVGYFANQLDHVARADIFVGGLPKIRTQPWEYKAVFSPIDVLEEYTRPARLVENGKIIVKPPLTEIEHLEFDEIGTLEAFNSDGLRTLTQTIQADNMREKTLRYPGYAQKIKLLADAGFLNPEKIDLQDQTISPLSITSKLLFDQWKLHKGEEDLTVMRIVVEGNSKGKQKRMVSNLHDQYDPETETHSMARTTGYAATMALRYLIQTDKMNFGITLPEQLATIPGSVDFILKGLKERNINYKNTHQML